MDLLATGADLTLRIGALSDSSLVARRITEFRRILCAAPGYLVRRGEPQTPADLTEHACLHYSNVAPRDEWTLIGPDGPETVVVSGPLCANNGDLLRQAAITGLGIVSLPEYLFGDDLTTGRLVPILTGHGTAPLACSALWPSRHRHSHSSAQARVPPFAQRTRRTESCLWLTPLQRTRACRADPTAPDRVQSLRPANNGAATASQRARWPGRRAERTHGFVPADFTASFMGRDVWWAVPDAAVLGSIDE